MISGFTTESPTDEIRPETKAVLSVIETLYANLVTARDLCRQGTNRQIFLSVKFCVVDAINTLYAFGGTQQMASQLLQRVHQLEATL